MAKPKIFRINQHLMLTIGLFIVTIATVSLIWLLNLPDFKTKNYFQPHSIAINSYDMFDLGVVDADGDDNLDIFTTNHSSQQSLLINQTAGKFKDRLSEWNLDQDNSFPQIEVTADPPETKAAGLYIFREKYFQWQPKEADNSLVIYARGIDRPIVGTIDFLSPIKIREQQDVTAEITESEIAPKVKLTTLRFTAATNGKLVLESDVSALPTKFSIEKLDPELIYLGKDKINPPNSGEFTLHWKDRHGMAWADYNADGAIDVLVSRGGLKGRIAQFRQIADLDDFLQDELFTNTGKEFRNTILANKVQKSSCPGRQTASVDFNNDNRLDFYVVCGKGTPPGELSPNQLHQQQADGTFINVAPQLGLAHQERGSFVWLDSDGDGDLDFLWATKPQFQLYLNEEGKFTPQPPIVKQKPVGTSKLTVADFDRDGDLDIYSAQSKQSVILQNEGGKYTAIKPQTLGLPAIALTANWVDYDSDGLIDLHAIPHGIYQQQANGKFIATDLLQPKFSFSDIDEARSAWFDYDNDGKRDLLMAVKYRPWWLRLLTKVKPEVPDPRTWQTYLYQNIGASDRSLEIELAGNPGNSQAIGTKVTVVTQNGEQIQQIGQADGSHYSQGHYRLYFGLGEQQTADRVKVEWFNDRTQIIEQPTSDRLLKIAQSISNPT